MGSGSRSAASTRASLPVHNMWMVERGLVQEERVWFRDTRGPVRRMAVSTHPEMGVIVMSLWQGDSCTGTFRLPLAEGARLIGAVADGLVAEHRA